MKFHLAFGIVIDVAAAVSVLFLFLFALGEEAKTRFPFARLTGHYIRQGRRNRGGSSPTKGAQ